MSSKLLDNKELPVTCPKCEKIFKKKVGRLNRNPNVTCLGCNQLITIDMKGFNSGVEGIEKTLKKTGFKRR